MIIQCEQCQTKFKLDDSRVAEKSIRVRCARCRHVFPVAGPQGLPQDSPSFEQDAPVFQIDDDQELTAADQTPGTAPPEFEFDTFGEVAPVADAADDSVADDAFSFPDEDEPAAPAETPAAADDFDFSLPPAESPVEQAVEEVPKSADDAFDFGAFDFGDESGEAAEPAAAAAPEPAPVAAPAAAPPKDDFGGLDFSGDDMFGDVASAASDDDAAHTISFDMGMDDFSDSMSTETAVSGQPASFATQETASENPFSLDDIDFGDELTSVAVQQVSPDELKPSQESLFSPLAAPQEKADQSGIDAFSPAAAPAAPEESPAAITTRRKEGQKVSGMLIFMGVIIAALVVFYSYWGYVTLTEDKGKISQETGRITVRSVEATYVKNRKAGDLLVITGEAVNEYGKPRAAIQVKGLVFGADGAEVASKSAFCGNPLTKDQLATLPLDKIEAAMANQFGDSLANMEVAAGDAIPFTIVIPRPPAGATDYGVEPVGSTVSTDKGK